jgi:hypothetical protein
LFESIVKIASRITDPITLAAFATAFLGMALYAVVKPKNRPIVWLLAPLTAIVGLTPVAARTYLSARGVYRISVGVLDQNNQPVADAELRTVPDTREDKNKSGWTLETTPQTRPADGRLIIFASVPNAFLSGQTTVQLAGDYFPSAQIHLTRLPSVTIRGQVRDENGLAVSGAIVTVPKCSLATVTDPTGLFHLDSWTGE